LHCSNPIRGDTLNYSIRKICMAMGCAAAMMAQVHAGTMKETFRSPDLPDLPYSAAVKVGDTIHVSGVTGHVRGGTSPVPGGVRAEAEQALTYIDEILGMAGSSMEKVVKCTV